MAYDNLFKPIRIGSMLVPNRVCHVPTDISSSNADGSVSERDIRHHSEVAKGGAGLIIVGATTPDAKSGRPTVTCLVADGDNFIPGLARLAASMHRYGAKCVVQLQHPGRQCAIPRYNIMSTNDMVMKLPWSAGHEIVYENAEEKGKEARAMSTNEVLEMVDLFSDAAWRVKQAGFDGVELHAAHGYLISMFMSPYLNRRNDRFGGSFENRMRFPLALIDSIRKKCGADFPVLVRYSVDEWVPGGRELPESIEVAKVLERAGVAALDLSQCIQESPGAGFDPMYYPEGWTVYASEAIKKAVSIPVINSHSLRTPEFCDKLIAENKMDLVGLSRQILADPYWPLKAKLGLDRSIRRCVSCLEGCWQESMMAKKEIACSINPACGNQAFDALKKTENPLALAVVGGGPAGLEAARIAALKGHAVTIFERTHELGGAILGCCLVEGKEKMKWYADWVRDAIADLGVKVLLGTDPVVADLKKFDLVIHAAGARSVKPSAPGAGLPHVIAMEEVMVCPKVTCRFHPQDGRKATKTGQKVVVWGDHYQAVDTAAHLARMGKDVTIVTPASELAREVEVIHMYVLRKRFAQGDAEALKSKPFAHPVKVIEKADIIEIREGSVTLDRWNGEFERMDVEADTIVSCSVKSDTRLLDELRAAGVPVINVGDSVRPRNLHAAVTEGAAAGLAVEGPLVINPNGAILDGLPSEVAAAIGR